MFPQIYGFKAVWRDWVASWTTLLRKLSMTVGVEVSLKLVEVVVNLSARQSTHVPDLQSLNRL
jgi:hypothetical protein